VPDPAGQQRCRVADHARRTAPGVDHRVPGVVAERRTQLRGVGAVRAPNLRAGDVVAGFAAVQGRDLVAASHRGLDHGTSDMVCSAEYEKSHVLILVDAGRPARTCSSTA